MPSLKKIAQVQSINDSLNKNKNFILFKHGSIATPKFEKLRMELKKTGSSLTVIKNTLFEKAVNILSTKVSVFKNMKKKFFPLREPTAIVYLGESWNQPLKAYYDFAQDQKNFSFKFGLLDNQIYDSPELEKISLLPTKDQLVAKLIGSLTNPTRKLVYTTKYHLNKLVFILKHKINEGR